MPGIEHRDTRAEIDVSLAVDVPDFSIGSAVDIDRKNIAHAAGKRFGFSFLPGEVGHE